MSHAPYTPPAAEVSDPPDAQYPKPNSIRLAVTCLWLSAALTVGTAALPFLRGRPFKSMVEDVAFDVIVIAVLAFVAVKLNAGRGWARWFFVAMYVFGLVAAILALLIVPQLLALQDTSEFVQIALETVALVSMFSRTSRQWLNALRAARISNAP